MKKLMVAIAAIAMLASSAYAADGNFYGSARVSTFYVSLDDADTDNYEQNLQGNSRIGATVKVSDELTGGFEYGSGVNLRKLYGEWDFGGGTFLVGQTYSPLNWFYSNQVYGTDNDLLGQGGIYSGREAMLRLKFGTFEIAAIAADTGYDGVAASDEVTFPAIEAKYTASFDAITIQVAGGYQTFELDDEHDIDSYVIALGGKMNFGAGYLNANVYAGQNAGNLIAVSVDGDNAWDDGYAGYDGVSVDDTDVMGFLVVAGYTVNDMFALEAGYGYAETELDSQDDADEVQSYYLQATITLAPGVMVIPEVGVIDGEESEDEETTYIGAKWQINF